MKKISGDPVIKFFVSVIGVIVIAMTLKELQHILLPFTIAYILFFIFEPMNKVLSRWKFPKSLIIITDISFILLILWVVSTIIINSFGRFLEQLPFYEDKLNGLLGELISELGLKSPALVNFKIFDSFDRMDVGGILSEFFTSTVSLFSAAFFILLFFVFISTGHELIIEAIRKRFVRENVKKSVEKIKKQFKADTSLTEEIDQYTTIELVKQEKSEKLEKTFKDITEQVQKYIATKFIITLGMGLLVGLTLWLFDIRFFIVLGVLTVLLNFIPNIGSVINVSFISIMVLVQYESWGFAAFIAAILIVEQNLIGNLLEPKIFGHRLGLNPLVILLSLLLWGYIWGVVGMFLAVPLTAILKIIVSGSNSKNLRFISDLMSST